MMQHIKSDPYHYSFSIAYDNSRYLVSRKTGIKIKTGRRFTL